jgi:hypothetical protein
MWKKEALVAEIKRRNPSARVNKKNASIPALFSKLTPLSPLDFPKDVAYIIAKEAEIRATLFAGVAYIVLLSLTFNILLLSLNKKNQM